jgi:hypothetical protein
MVQAITAAVQLYAPGDMSNCNESRVAVAYTSIGVRQPNNVATRPPELTLRVRAEALGFCSTPQALRDTRRSGLGPPLVAWSAELVLG